MTDIEKLQFDPAQIFYILDLGVKKCFFLKILLILPQFHEKNLSRPGDIKIFCPGRRMYMCPLPPFMETVLSEGRQLMKWVGIFQVGIFPGRIFLEAFIIK